MNRTVTRRDFLAMSAKGVGVAVISYGLMGCSDSNDDNSVPAQFLHGIASGDPAVDAVILWTRVTPESEGDVKVSWQVASDAAFSQLVTTGETVTNASRDYTVKIDARGLRAGQTYFYRFMTGDKTSVVGKTRTLPEGDVSSVKLAVMSCANFPAGYFNVYELAAAQDDLDAVVHLGDYIYEYARGGYASEHAAELGREVLPANELLTLSDYRTRHGQYHTDASLQKLHAKVPFITVWDDHEVANDTWRDSAENHNEGEGDFAVRKEAALQAYFEWLPIRPWREGNHEEIYRSFSYGNLVDLHMLDTRVLARDKQLDYADYMDPTTGSFAGERFLADVTSTTRTMLGLTQLLWLQGTLLQSTGKWQVLGQQVLMGKMSLPAAIATQQMSIPQFAMLGALAKLAARAAANDPTLTAQELQYLQANQALLTPEVIALLQLPAIPYNLDAWDGYAYEREVILGTAKSKNLNLVVIAGDTHNAWANELKDVNGDTVGVEFATSSVSSPGLEYYLNLPAEQIPATEAAIVELVPDLKYANLKDRGFMTLTFTADEVRSDWHYVDTILSKDFQVATARGYSAKTKVGEHVITPIV
ncbi:alkaline phosphatase D family protein [Shewanella oncorhynchi]|uniref:Alkaline phosphatase D family protein n=1 Tax=Shewanella oncorhynchi TaxID=2726434 RepID=A0AA50KC54_9GAMM|nr:MULTISPECIES: alkaline phosphatase D family protein [Shewanella]MCU8001954.1 alkaline phosphatase D family protein [Shewanella sp. SM96]MCU8060387.1 alkaline phosphatase D family protein [Shewanella sp. SM55]MCU8082924.1 alkaline phosphatase D family protein [Shewanella sp. SM23]MCU8086632.1 alkaline phosphatase D family protein [Shewanella sp. SM21]WMB72373.1 alkaline phosphatase D family protein [Shewanella oncorhynchi]